MNRVVSLRPSLSCFGARYKGICDNRLTIRRDDDEARALKALQEKLLSQERFEQPESRVEATEALRGLVDAIVLTPNGSKEELGIELRGNLAAMLGATVQTKRSPESDDLSLQVSLVAGAGFEPATFGL